MGSALATAAQRKVPPFKQAILEDLRRIASDYPVIGVVTITGVPGPAILKMRAKLRGTAELRVAKNTLMRRAIEAADKKRPGLKQLLPQVVGQAAIIGTNANPFRLYKELASTRMKIPAKGGEIAEDEIAIAAGETDFKPGPIVGELSKVGIPAGIESGKVVIKKDKVLVKKGDVISREIALALGKLNIKPVTVGLMLRCAYEGDTLYPPDALAIDETVIMGNLARAGRSALALALHIGWATPDTIVALIQKGRREALAVALAAGYASPDTIEFLLARAALHAAMLRSIETGEPLTGPAGAADGGAERGGKSSKPAPEEKKVTEAEAAAGLGSLFGD